MLKARLFFFLLFRVFNTIFVRTYFDPDEYWQSQEVAHWYTFGYGYLTWEWSTAIRGFSHPAIFALLFTSLQKLNLDFPILIAFGPRLLQAVFAAIGDYYLFLLSEKWFGEKAAKYTMLLHLTNWFTFYCIIRTYSNSLETIFNIVALYYWPWAGRLAPKDNLMIGLSFAALSCIIRPTSAIFWIYVGMRHLFHMNSLQHGLSFILKTILVGSIFLLLSIMIDSLFYSSFQNVIWNFLKFNVVSNASSQYGTHHWAWYFFGGLPTMLSSYSLLVIESLFFSSHPFDILGLILFFMCIFSFMPHKEFRFIFPILPFVLMLLGKYLSQSIPTQSSRRQKIKFFCLVLINVIFAIYFAQIHQRGTIDAINYIREDQSIQSIDFLTNCHATPFYSHIHRNITMSFLECPPRLDPGDPPTQSDIFFDTTTPEEMAQFLSARYSDRLPSHLVLFDEVLILVESFLSLHNYTQKADFFHSHFPSKRILIYSNLG